LIKCTQLTCICQGQQFCECKGVIDIAICYVVVNTLKFCRTHYRVTTLPGKSWKVIEFSKTIFQAWKVIENSQGHGKSWKMKQKHTPVVFSYDNSYDEQLEIFLFCSALINHVSFISKKYAVPIGHGNSFLVMEKSWKIIVEKEWSPCHYLTRSYVKNEMNMEFLLEYCDSLI